MSEGIPAPRLSDFPELDEDPRWVRDLVPGTMLARIFRSAGPHPSEWFDFREYGPLDGRFDPHPLPRGEHPGAGVMYAAVERARAGDGESASATDSAFAACLLEVFQRHRLIDRVTFSPAFVMFELEYPLRLLDLAESDWVTAAGGNSAISSGPRSLSREWARAIRSMYPELDGIIAPSSLVPSARVATLWSPAARALPTRPEAVLPLDRSELHAVIDAVAARYGYDLI